MGVMLLLIQFVDVVSFVVMVAHDLFFRDDTNDRDIFVFHDPTS